MRVEERQERTYRSLLGVPAAGATVEDVRRCHRREMLRWHPDRGGDGRRAQLLNAARDYFTQHPDRISADDSVVGMVVEPSVPVSSVDADGSSRRKDLVSAPHPSSSSVPRWVVAAVLGYFGLLTFSVLGWLFFAFLSAIADL